MGKKRSTGKTACLTKYSKSYLTGIKCISARVMQKYNTFLYWGKKMKNLIHLHFIV